MEGSAARGAAVVGAGSGVGGAPSAAPSSTARAPPLDSSDGSLEMVGAERGPVGVGEGEGAEGDGAGAEGAGLDDTDGDGAGVEGAGLGDADGDVPEGEGDGDDGVSAGTGFSGLFAQFSGRSGVSAPTTETEKVTRAPLAPSLIVTVCLLPASQSSGTAIAAVKAPWASSSTTSHTCRSSARERCAHGGSCLSAGRNCLPSSNATETNARAEATTVQPVPDNTALWPRTHWEGTVIREAPPDTIRHPAWPAPSTGEPHKSTLLVKLPLWASARA